MHWLPVLVRACPPGVVPEPSPAALLLVADQIRDDSALSLELGEPAEDRKSGGTAADDANLPNHFLKEGLRYSAGKNFKGVQVKFSKDFWDIWMIIWNVKYL